MVPSFLIDTVTYVDMDHRARQFFEDRPGVDSIIASSGRGPGWWWRFIAQDYRQPLPDDCAPVDLLVSLFAGPVSAYCSDLLAPGGWLLANTSHGDVALAATDPRYELRAVLNRNPDGHYRIKDQELSGYLVPRAGEPPSRAQIIETNRGIAYERRANYYLFQRNH